MSRRYTLRDWWSDVRWGFAHPGLAVRDALPRRRPRGRRRRAGLHRATLFQLAVVMVLAGAGMLAIGIHTPTPATPTPTIPLRTAGPDDDRRWHLDRLEDEIARQQRSVSPAATPTPSDRPPLSGPPVPSS